MTQGIVSSTSRWIKERGSGFIVNAIQTSAGINPGNSGGGLVDLNGEVIGIPTLEGYDPRHRSAAPGIGFAIPSNTVTRVASKLIGAYGHSVTATEARTRTRMNGYGQSTRGERGATDWRRPAHT